MIHFWALVLLMVGTAVNGYIHFQERIPNGNRIPHPCKPNYMWYGVGHNNTKGGGVRNVFGEAFESYGFEWNKCICEEDSDGDGLSNGHELGDPNCVWTVGQTPERTTGLSHPGICDPFNSTACTSKNTWFNCSQELGFTCEEMNQPDVQNFTIKFPPTPVPSVDTTYICQAFDLTPLLPSGESHLIGTLAEIDNQHVMHHIIVYACDDTNGPSALQTFGTPRSCDMGSSLCPNMIALWTVGVDGYCFNPNAGFPLGVNGYKTVVMEFHWNNPELRSDHVDGSGMKLFVNTNKRQHDAGVWFIGPPLVQVPPGFSSYTNVGGCSSACTSIMLNQTVYLTDIVPHMHYLGTAFTFQQYRSGQMLYQLNVDRYFYDDPLITQFSTPLEVQPGDELKVTCTFQSKDKTNFTYYGDATSAEMCFGILFYYPFSSSVTFCQTNNGYGFCNNTLYPNPFPSVCDYNSWNTQVQTSYTAILANCDQTGRECYSGCSSAIAPLVNHPCMQSNAGDTVKGMYMYSTEGQQVLTYMASCDTKPVAVAGDASIRSITCGADNVHLTPILGCVVIIIQSLVKPILNKFY